jgi:hypothetical protein
MKDEGHGVSQGENERQEGQEEEESEGGTCGCLCLVGPYPPVVPFFMMLSYSVMLFALCAFVRACMPLCSCDRTTSEMRDPSFRIQIG